MYENAIYISLKAHYLKTGNILSPFQLNRMFQGIYTSSDVVEAVLSFDQWLDRHRKEGMRNDQAILG